MTKKARSTNTKFNFKSSALNNSSNSSNSSNSIPFISIVICSYNKPELLRKCLSSILRQDYPKEQYEIIIVDGGNNHATPAIFSFILSFKNIKRINNPNRLPEGKGNGKWLGYRNISPKAKYVAFIDQDNEIQGKDWLRRMIEPMEDYERVAGCHSRLLCKASDKIINRYAALIGTDPFAAYRSVDGYLGFMGIRNGSCSCYVQLDGNPRNMMITGGNAFVYRRSALDEIGGYTQDTDNIALMAKRLQSPVIYIPDAWTHHHAFSSVGNFLKKKALWGRQPQSKVFKWIPEDSAGRIRLLENIIANLIIVPNIYIAVKNAVRDKESAWLLHPFLSFATTIIYGFNFLNRKVFKE